MSEVADGMAVPRGLRALAKLGRLFRSGSSHLILPYFVVVTRMQKERSVSFPDVFTG